MAITPQVNADMLDRAKAGSMPSPRSTSLHHADALRALRASPSRPTASSGLQRGAAWSGSSAADGVRAPGHVTYSRSPTCARSPSLHTAHCPRKLVDTWLQAAARDRDRNSQADEPTAFSPVIGWLAETLDDNIKLVVEAAGHEQEGQHHAGDQEIGAVGA